MMLSVTSATVVESVSWLFNTMIVCPAGAAVRLGAGPRDQSCLAILTTNNYYYNVYFSSIPLDDNLDQAITSFLSTMVPDHFSTTNNLIQGIEEFINVLHSNPEPQVSPLNPTGRSGTLHVIHRLDESSNESSVQVQRLQRELVEKENRIKELEARETFFLPRK